MTKAKGLLVGECPCGRYGPLEMFVSTVDGKRCIMICAEMPSEVCALAIYYLGLFRPGSGRNVSIEKAKRLLGELRDLVKTGYVQHNRLVARECPPQIWAEAIGVMLDQQAGLSLPMPNHNYLIKVAYDKANAADRVRESDVRTAEQNHRRPCQLAANAVRSVPAAWAITDTEDSPSCQPTPITPK